MDTYEYLVSYTFDSPTRSGSGRVFFTRTAPISSPEDIEEIEAIQNERNGFTCAIMGFYLLNHSKGNNHEG